MEKRSENPRDAGAARQSSNGSRNHISSKKNKRRGGKKNNTISHNSGNTSSGASGGSLVSECVESRQQPMNSNYKNYMSTSTATAATAIPSPSEYGNVFWQQSGMQQQLLTTTNGQRLFAAVSDPTVCGYSPMPMTYAMEPVSLPPMYQLYQPIARPNYRSYNRVRTRRNHAQPPSPGITGPKMNPGNQVNGYSSLQENNFSYSMGIGYQNGDYASLPPVANMENETNAEELSSEHRRYSDPGLGPAQIPVNANSDDSESQESGSSVTTVGRSSKLVLSLIEQVTALKESNSQLFKELHQTKSELENVKIELGRLKQSNFADYQPGMLSDIVREMREAAKVREESLISKVKSMMNEKQPQATIESVISIEELDELKNQLTRITEEKAETETRLAKVEHELATLKSNANHEGQEIVALEEETLALRRELQEARASRTSAENRAAKCVKAVARPVTPVTVISTPSSTNDIHTIAIITPSKTQETSSSSITAVSTDSTEKMTKNDKIAAIVVQPAFNFSKLSKISDSKILKDDERKLVYEIRATSTPKSHSDQNNRREDRVSSNDRSSLSTKNNSGEIVQHANKSKSICSERYHDNMKNFEKLGARKMKLKKNFSLPIDATTVNSVIPDVAVVSAGKSLTTIPKKPCSVKILSTKGLKPPPTKATYTTAYI